jgi:hypothetical protein
MMHTHTHTYIHTYIHTYTDTCIISWTHDADKKLLGCYRAKFS